MSNYSTETLCAMTGANRANLRRWQRLGLVSRSNDTGWNKRQQSEVMMAIIATADGANLHNLRNSPKSAPHNHKLVWRKRQDRLLSLLESGSDREVSRFIRIAASDVLTDNFINDLMVPLNKWLRMDELCGSDERLTRFHHAVVFHFSCVKRASSRHNALPLLLERISSHNETEIWLEAIRLTGQGFCVDVCDNSAIADEKYARHHEHHLLWCGAGISPECQAGYRQELEAGMPVMLRGPDCRIRLARDNVIPLLGLVDS